MLFLCAQLEKNILLIASHQVIFEAHESNRDREAAFMSFFGQTTTEHS